MKCPNCGEKVDLSDPEIREDAEFDGIYVCSCCEEINVSSIL
jgi:hypothetical protein